MFWNWLALVCLLLDSCSLNSAYRNKNEFSAAFESIGTITVKNSDATSNQTEAKEDAMLDDLLNSQMALINQSMPPPAKNKKLTFGQAVRKVIKNIRKAKRTVEDPRSAVTSVASKQATTCGDVYKAIVNAGKKLEDPEFGPDSPFFKSFSTGTDCKMVIGGDRKVVGETEELITKDMQRQCPDTRKVFEDGTWYECRPKMPKGPYYGSGFGYIRPFPFYKAICNCHAEGTLSSPAPSCATISQDMLKNKERKIGQQDWTVHEKSTGYCTISGFIERMTELTAYLKLPNGLKKKAWSNNLEATFPIRADEFSPLLFYLIEDLRLWTKKLKGTQFDGMELDQIRNIAQNTLEGFFRDWARDWAFHEGLKVPEVPDDVRQFYATKVSSVLKSARTLEEAQVEIARMKFKNDKHVLGNPKLRMTRELCLKAMLIRGCPEELVTFLQGVKEPGISSDKCKCSYQAK